MEIAPSYSYFIWFKNTSKNIIQTLNWERYLKIANVCGVFRSAAPLFKALNARRESSSPDVSRTREKLELFLELVFELETFAFYWRLVAFPCSVPELWKLSR